MNKKNFTIIFWLNIVLLVVNLYIGYTSNKYNYFTIACNILLAVGMYLLSKNKK